MQLGLYQVFSSQTGNETLRDLGTQIAFAWRGLSAGYLSYRNVNFSPAFLGTWSRAPLGAC